jgi:hypothetical protein
VHIVTVVVAARSHRKHKSIKTTTEVNNITTNTLAIRPIRSETSPISRPSIGTESFLIPFSYYCDLFIGEASIFEQCHFTMGIYTMDAVPADALSTANVKDSLGLGVMRNIQPKNTSHHWGGESGDKPHFWQDLPLETYTSINNFYSLRVKLTWHNQGWGNRKGKVMVMKHMIKGDDKEVPAQNFQTGTIPGGVVIYETPEMAPHNAEEMEFGVMLDPLSSTKYKYSLWVIVGGGCGHALTLTDLRLSALVYDDPQQSLVRQHANLQNTGIYSNASCDLCMSLLLQASKLAHACHQESLALNQAASTTGVNEHKPSSSLESAAQSLTRLLYTAGFGVFSNEEDVRRLESLQASFQKVCTHTELPSSQAQPRPTVQEMLNVNEQPLPSARCEKQRCRGCPIL